MSRAIEIQNLSVDYQSKKNKFRAVESLNLQIEEGEFYGLLGPNGAGKTSVISVIASLLETPFGRVEIFGHRVGTLAAKRMLGYVPQELVNHGFFSVTKVLQFYSGYFGIRDNKKRIEMLLERLSLTAHAHKKVSELSGGMKRRFLIAKALLHNPKLLLLDEPSAGVDVELRTALWSFAQELNKAGTTILLTTHYLEEAQRLCNRVGILNRGRLIASDRTGSLVSRMAERRFHIYLAPGSSGSSIRSNDNRVVIKEQSEEALVVVAPGTLRVGEVCTSLGLRMDQIQDLRVEEGALEEAFLKIIASEEGRAHGSA